MAIVQMNWGRMKFAPDDPRMSEFTDALAVVYAIAENHDGFVWRSHEDTVAADLIVLGYDERVTAALSVWESVEDLRAYTFNTLHGEFFDRKTEWFERVASPQLVIWDVEREARPGIAEAFERMAHMVQHGDSDIAYGWPRN